MKSLITALVLTAASILPVSAGIHDFNPANAAPKPTQTKARTGEGQCVRMTDNSEICYVKSSPTSYSIAIDDVDYPGVVEVAHIECSTGRWYAYGGIPKTTLDMYLGEFCTRF
jgi:hypothetical protein